jgi:hypothetical protein
MKKSIGMLVCCLAAVLLGTCRGPGDRPGIPPLSFERISDSHVLVTGSWQSNATTGAPHALVFIECRRATQECTEMRAQIVSDEHGVKGDRLMPDFTHYQIKEWSGSKIRATGRYRDKWPVQLSIDVAAGLIHRESGAEDWTLE